MGIKAGVGRGTLQHLDRLVSAYGVTDPKVLERAIASDLQFKAVSKAQLERLHAMPDTPRACTDWIDPEIKVTKINKRWHARLIFQGTVRDELACECSEDIGLICKEMLRWFDKMGNISEYADKARHRASTVRPYKGKVWYRPQLEQEKLKRMKAALINKLTGNKK